MLIIPFSADPCLTKSCGENTVDNTNVHTKELKQIMSDGQHIHIVTEYICLIFLLSNSSDFQFRENTSVSVVYLSILFADMITHGLSFKKKERECGPNRGG